MRNPIRYVLPAMATALLSAGCSTAVTGSGTPAAYTPGKAASTSTSPVHGSRPTTTSAGPLTAANGANVSACHTADCEILIRDQVQIPLDPKFHCPWFIVAYTTPNRIAFDLNCEATGSVTGYFLGTGVLRPATTITMEVNKIDQTGAVLHLRPTMTTEDPTRNQVSGQFGAAFT